MRNGKPRADERKGSNTNGIHPSKPKPAQTVVFEEMGLAPLTLQGKQNSVHIPLTLGDQTLMAGDQVQLALVVWLDDATSAGANGAKHSAMLTVELNGTVVGAIPLEQSGAQTATLTIPLLTTARTDGAYALHLTLCSHDLHEPAPEMTVVIRSTSRLVLNARHSLLTVEN